MNQSKLCCDISFINQKKIIFADSYENLLIIVKEKFKLPIESSLLIQDADESEIDSDAFEGYRDANLPKLKLNISLKNQTDTPKYELDSLDCIIFTNGTELNYNMKFEPNIRLDELSTLILEKMTLDAKKFVCFFYDCNGQPLAPNFYTSQFLKLRDVLKKNESVYVLVSKNCYENEIIKKVGYERTTLITAILKDTTEKVDIKINLNHDKLNQIKDLIGLQISFPSSCIKVENTSIQNLPQTLRLVYEIIEKSETSLKLSNYNTLLEQSEKGLRLLRNFMACLHKEFYYETINHKFIAAIRYMVSFNPLLYSFYLIINQKVITEAELIAFDEGILILFTLIRDKLNLNIATSTLFEFTLEFFAFLLEFLNIEKWNKENFLTKIISNPNKIRNPIIVNLAGGEQEIYDLTYIEDLKRKNKNISNCNQHLDDMKVDQDLKLLINRTSGNYRAEMVLMNTEFDISFNKDSFFRSGPSILNLSDFEALKKKHDITQITSYLDLKENSKRKTITYNTNKVFAVLLGTVECSSDVSLKDFYSETTMNINPVRLSSIFNELAGSQITIKSKVPEVQQENYSRTPEEAIAVLVDTSGSMETIFLDTNKTRSTIAKDFFNSFVNKSIGYNLAQVISLKTFDTIVKKVADFTENVYKFCEYLETIKCEGGTSIYDAINTAIKDLIVIKSKYTEIKGRIICFSDGEDNSSKSFPLKLLNQLIGNNIILDCINLGEDCTSLKNISLCSGGFAFWCESMEKGFKIFESDAFISIKFRESCASHPNLSIDELESSKFKSFTVIPPPVKKPNQIKLKAANVSSSLMAMEIAKPKFSSQNISIRFKRINRELAMVHKNPHPDIQIYPCECDLNFWNAIILGPDSTPYQGGIFHIYISLPDEYPIKPPEIRFLTPIYHLNVNSSGRICISILNSDYGPEITILRLLQSIYGLLMNPEDLDSLDTNIASIYRSSRQLYDETAVTWTALYAKKPVLELLEGINQREVLSDIPTEFICPISQKIMTEPIFCQVSGITYEKEIIENYIREFNCDPLTKQPATLSDLHRQHFLENCIKKFKNFS